MLERPILVDQHGTDSRIPARWAGLLARTTGSHVIEVQEARSCEVLDLAIKREACLIVTPRDLATDATGPEDRLALLMRRGPVPVLAVPPWSGDPPRRLATIVVGVDRSCEADAAARLAAARLRSPEEHAHLVVAHGSTENPWERAGHTPWRALVDEMRASRHGWLGDVARSLRSENLAVEAVVELCWAQRLISGLAQRHSADLVCLGAARWSEDRRPRLGTLHRAVLRSIPCPLLIGSAGPGHPT